MFKNRLLNTIGEIKTPERKLNVLMPVLALLALAGVVYFMYNQITDTGKQRLNEKDSMIIQVSKDNIVLRRTNDSLIIVIFNMNYETIHKLELLMKVQDEQKNQLRKK